MSEIDNDRLYRLAEKQAETNANLANAQHDINSIANAQRQDAIELRSADDRIETKVDDVKIDLRIYKAIVGLISAAIVGIVAIAAWIVENLDNIRGLTK